MKKLLLLLILLPLQNLFGQDIVAKTAAHTYSTSVGTTITKFIWNDTSVTLVIPTYEMYYFSDKSANVTVHSNGRITFNSKSTKSNKGAIDIWGADLCWHKTLPSSIQFYVSTNPGSSSPDQLTIVWKNAGFVDDTAGTAFINFSVTIDAKATNGFKTYIDVGSYGNINNAWFTGGAPGIRLTNPNGADTYQLSNIDTNYTFTKNSSSMLFLSGLPASNTRLSIYNPIQLIDDRNYALTTDIDYPVLWVNNTGKKVNVQYSSDDGNTWNTIASGLDSFVYHYEYWNVPNQFFGRFLFRVITIDGATSGISYNHTALYYYGPSQSLSVIAPNNGELFQAGKKMAVRWNSTNVPLVYIGIYNPTLQTTATFGVFKSNNGANIDSIMLPNNYEIDKGFIHIWGTFSSVSFQSPVPFANAVNPISITRKSSALLLKTPSTNNAEFAFGSIVPVTYAMIGVRKVKLQHINEDQQGATWKTVVDSMLPTGSYNWKVPADSTTLGRLRISSIDDTTVFSSSTIYFKISPPRLSLQTPLAGQKYTGGNNVNIAWTNFGVRKLKIEYTTNGTVWNTIVDSVVATSPYVWLIPNEPSTNCKIRIADIDYPTVTALTGQFEIAANPTVLSEQNIEAQINCWPNPAHELVLLSTTSPIQLETVTLFDILGNKVLSQYIGVSQQEINLTTLHAGIYFMEITTNKGIVRKQLIKD